MKIYCDINGNKRAEDDGGNVIELSEMEKEIMEASNAGGEVDAREIMDILRKYGKRS